ncbi:MAG: transposase [Planctomycetaceae bacterium]
MKKRRSTEQIVGLLRQADLDLGKGTNVPDVCRRLGISQQTYSLGGRSLAAWIRRWPSSFKSSRRRTRG